MSYLDIPSEGATLAGMAFLPNTIDVQMRAKVLAKVL
jgi:hypothetical protein